MALLRHLPCTVGLYRRPHELHLLVAVIMSCFPERILIPILLDACVRPSHGCDRDVGQELSCVGFQKIFLGVCPFLPQALIPYSIPTSQPEMLEAGTNPWCYCRRGESFLMVDRRILLRQSAV
jgi:hypothetical protein